MNKTEGFGKKAYLILIPVTAVVFFLCVCLGSVNVSLGDTLAALKNLFTGTAVQAGNTAASIITTVRLPRVLCAALMGAVDWQNTVMIGLALGVGYDVVMVLVSWLLYDFVVSV